MPAGSSGVQNLEKLPIQELAEAATRNMIIHRPEKELMPVDDTGSTVSNDGVSIQDLLKAAVQKHASGAVPWSSSIPADDLPEEEAKDLENKESSRSTQRTSRVKEENTMQELLKAAVRKHASKANSSVPGQTDDDEGAEDNEPPEVFYVVDVDEFYRCVDGVKRTQKMMMEALETCVEAMKRQRKLVSELAGTSAGSLVASFVRMKTGEETGYPEPRKLVYTRNDELDQLSKRCLELRDEALVAPTMPEYAEIDFAVPLESGGVFIAMVDRSRTLSCDADSYEHPVNPARNASTMLLNKFIDLERAARSSPPVEVIGAGVFSPSFRHLNHEEAELLVQKMIDSAPELREVRRLKEAGMFFLIRM